MSKHLGVKGIRGVIKLGNVIIPGDNEFPSFEIQFQRIQGEITIDRMLDYLVKNDLDGLKILLPILACTPTVFLRILMKMVDEYQKIPIIFQEPFRLLYIGLKGLILTLYYSDLDSKEASRGEVLKKIEWNAQMENHQEWAMEEDKISKEPVGLIFKRARESAIHIKNLSLKERINIVNNLRQIILHKKEYIIDRILAETKKSRLDALASEIYPVLDHLQFIEQKAYQFLKDQKISTPLALMGKKSQVVYDPMGVILVISPWNYPFYQALTPITTSFVCGNATIFKPSEYTPMKGLVEEILQEAGISLEWVQVVYGDGKKGAQLILEGPDKIFFTGSVGTGKAIMKAASEKLIPVELELGGKDPMIVFSDANIDRAVAGALWGAMTNTGQSCTSVENLYVHEKIYPEFMKLLKRKSAGLTLGSDKDGSCDIGAMTTPLQVAIIKRQYDEMKAKGVAIHSAQWDGKNPVIPPMIIEGELEDLSVWKEETFGPLLPVIKFSDEGEVIHLCNQSQYGLSASVWSADKNRCLRVARLLKTGNVSINNVMLTEGNHHLPFGGTKMSGFGRYKGRWGLESFSNIKSILIDGNSSKIEANWYPYTKQKYFLFSKMTENYFGKGLLSFFKFAFYGLRLEGEASKSWKKLGVTNKHE